MTVSDQDAPSAAVELVEDRGYQARLLGVVMLSVMAFGSLMTIVTVALGEIAEDLGSDRATMTWMITGLMLAMAVATPLAGKLGDLYGHKRIFLLGLAGGVITTVLSAVAWDASSLIAFRVLFGLTGALVMPNGMALMMQAYSIERRSTAMGWFQFGMTGAPTIGLVAGGPLIEVVGWRVLFVGFAAVTVVALVFGSVVVSSTVESARVPLDYWGALLLGGTVLTSLVGLTTLTEGLGNGGLLQAVSQLEVLALLALSLLMGVSFVVVENRTENPMLRLDYFRRRNFTLPMVSSACMQFAYMGGFVVTPALLGSVYGWKLATISLVLVPRPGVFSLASPLGGYLATKIGERRPIILGSLLMVASMVAFAFASQVDASENEIVAFAIVALGLSLSGAAAGVSQPSVASMVSNSVDAADLGVANGMNQQVTFIGIVSGIQMMNVLIGDSIDPQRFTSTFLFGGVIALAGLGAAFGIGRQGN